MGQFSWLYSDTEEQMIDDLKADSYLLVPPAFHNEYGEYIKETCYDGYGDFGGYDVYNLVAKWNKDYIPTVIRLIEEGKWHCCSRDSRYYTLLKKYYNNETTFSDEEREVGITLACYDEDNERLQYPIKITSKPMDYNFVAPSETDPNQGWYCEEDCWEEEDY